MSKKKEFVVSFRAMVPVQVMVRGVMTVQADSEKQAKQIAKSIRGVDVDGLPKSCRIEGEHTEIADDMTDLSEVIYHEVGRDNFIKIDISDEDVEDLTEA